MKKYWPLVTQTAQQWQEDKVPRLAAALAYFTAISIAPLSLLVIVIAGFLWGGERAARMELMRYVESAIGPEGAGFVDMVVKNADRPTFGSIAGLIGIVTLLWGATNVFTQLQITLNTVWGVPEEDNVLVQNVRQRFLSFAMVLVVAFLLLVSIALSTFVQAMVRSIQSTLPGGEWMWQLANFCFATVITTLLFAAIYKVLPDVEVAWQDVWIGALATAILFGMGRFLLSYYLAQIGSAYGVAGSMIAFLIWVYFSAQILFLGAEFTQVYGRLFGSHKDSATLDATRSTSYSPASTTADIS